MMMMIIIIVIIEVVVLPGHVVVSVNQVQCPAGAYSHVTTLPEVSTQVTKHDPQTWVSLSTHYFHCHLDSIQNDRLSGKPGNVGKFVSCQGNVRKCVVEKCCLGKLLLLLILYLGFCQCFVNEFIAHKSDCPCPPNALMGLYLWTICRLHQLHLFYKYHCGLYVCPWIWCQIVIWHNCQLVDFVITIFAIHSVILLFNSRFKFFSVLQIFNDNICLVHHQCLFALHVYFLLTCLHTYSDVLLCGQVW